VRRLAIAIGCGLLLAAGFAAAEPPAWPPPAVRPDERPLPINLATALQLANARGLDIQFAAARVQAASAALDRARVLWLPNIVTGVDITRHDGQIQDIVGNVFGTSRQALFVGAGPNMQFAVTDALYAPLAARQVVRARQFEQQAIANDTMLAVADAYFGVQQARGDLAGAEAFVRYGEELVRRAEQLAPGLAPPLEANRARTELARRRQAVVSLRERWQVAGAELTRIVRLDAAAQVEPEEPAVLQVTLVDPATVVDDLIPMSLRCRPELAARQAIVEATLTQIKQEKIRPFVPSVLIRGISTSNPGLAGGLFGGGVNSTWANFGARSDWDAQLVWEIQNLGFGNRARIRERKAEHQAALIDVFRIQDRIAAEVVQANAQVQSARQRITDAQAGLTDAADTFNKSLEGMTQTRRSGELLILVIRPSEAVLALQALAQANADYFAAIADYNRAQFRLYRALGQPADCLGQLVTSTNPVICSDPK
jgi:outer membrane protein TolC